jgi:hypothetical protein
MAGGVGAGTPNCPGNSNASMCDHHASRSSTISCIMKFPA